MDIENSVLSAAKYYEKMHKEAQDRAFFVEKSEVNGFKFEVMGIWLNIAKSAYECKARFTINEKEYISFVEVDMDSYDHHRTQIAEYVRREIISIISNDIASALYDEMKAINEY